MQPWIKSAETFTWKECNACWSFRNLHQINLLQWCTANKSLWEVITGISSWVGVGIPIPLSKFCFRMQNKTHNASRWKHWENIFEWNSWIFIDRNRSAVTGMEKHLHSEPELPNSQLGIVMHTFRKVRKETQPSSTTNHAFVQMHNTAFVKENPLLQRILRTQRDRTRP